MIFVVKHFQKLVSFACYRVKGDEAFIFGRNAPFKHLERKQSAIIINSCLLECLRNEKTMMGSKVYRRQVCMSPVHREVPKTNGHSLSLPTSITPELHATPRLGRPLNLKSYGTPRYSLHCINKSNMIHNFLLCCCLFFVHAALILYL